MMIDCKKTGKLICLERKKLNLTQEDLASMLFVSRQAISKWERGICMPDYSSFLYLSKIFNITINEFLEGKRNNN